MRKLFGGLAAAAMLAGALALAPPAQAAAPPAAPTYTPPPIAFGQCTNPTLQRFGAECGMLTVPLDYTNPGGQTIQLAVSRIKHKTPDRPTRAITLVNPGGPGGSGLIYSVFQRFVPNDAGLPYDWIGFDPRGVGAASPR